MMLIKHLWPSLLSTIAVFILCLTPSQNLPKVEIVNIDKLAHAGLFGVLAYLYALGFYRQTSSSLLKSHFLLAAFMVAVGLGGLIELLQANLDINRSGDWFDFLFDIAGALLVSGLIRPAQRYFPLILEK